MTYSGRVWSYHCRTQLQALALRSSRSEQLHILRPQGPATLMGLPAMRRLPRFTCRSDPSLRASPDYTVTGCRFFTSNNVRDTEAVGDKDALSGLEVELLVPGEDDSVLGSDLAGFGDGHTEGFSAPVETITALNPFAKAKVSNFLQRMGGGAGGAAGIAEIREVQGSGRPQYYARIHIPLPSEYGDRYGEGFASTEKEAEVVAAMHAERVIDALGFPIFLLSSKQLRHAESAKAAGRFAPSPGASPNPPSTPSPSPLQYAAEGEVRQVERELHLDKVVFTKVKTGVFTPLRWTLASPYFLDHGSVQRIKQFYSAYNVSVPRYSKVMPLHKMAKFRQGPRGGIESSMPSSRPEACFVAQMRLPIQARFGDRICMGKAPTRKEAITLACMHAELTIDALGLALYPNQYDTQLAHAEECRRVNRWCAAPGECDYRYTVPTPPPLELEIGSDVAAATPLSANTVTSAVGVHHGRTTVDAPGETKVAITAEVNDGGASVETLLVQHSRAVGELDRFMEVLMLESAARAQLLCYIGELDVGTSRSGPSTAQTSEDKSPFFVEALGTKLNGCFRATATIPLREAALDNSSGVPWKKSNHSFVAIGIAATAEAAETAASMHALDTLAVLNQPVSIHNAFMQAEVDRRSMARGLPTYKASSPFGLPTHISESALPPAVRFLPEHIGRISTLGLAAAERRRHTGISMHSASEQSRFDNCVGHLEHPEKRLKELLDSQKRLPALEWSLEADGDHRIVVSPDAVVGTGRNYVHTLPGVRSPDVFAVPRLRDYLERHGKRLESVLTRSVHETEEGLRLWTVKVILPVAVTMGAARSQAASLSASARYIAHGEGYSAEDAVVMCAMHAELLLDAMGFLLYDNPTLQRRHADTARMLGRWAPLVVGELPPTVGTQLPPPVRKEHAKSCLWARLEKERCRKPEQRVHSADILVGTSSSPVPYEGAMGESQSCMGDGPALFQTPLGGTRDVASGTPTDDELCDIDKLQSVHHREVLRMALRHMNTYYQSRGSDFFRALRQYTINSAKHGIVHRAVAEIPLPPQYGRRYAVGCGNNKKLARLLCATHGVFVLDALGIQVYSGRRQLEYAKHAAIRGRKAPRPGEAMMPAATLSPKGLCCLAGQATVRPPIPEVPPEKELRRDGRLWVNYVHASRTFIAKVQDQELHEALFEEKQAPRKGIEVEDEGLDVVESVVVNMHSKNDLPRLCKAVGLPPPLTPFHYEAYGRPPHRRFLTEVPVNGTPYQARGAADTWQESVARAAMHYEYIITHVVQRNGDDSSFSRRLLLGTQRHVALFDAVKGEFTPKGKLMGLRLFACTYPPFKPLSLSLKERSAGISASSGAAPSPAHVALLVLEDDVGLKAAGKGVDPKEPEEAVWKATHDLFTQLQRKATFQAVMRQLKLLPGLREETILPLIDDNLCISTAADSPAAPIPVNTAAGDALPLPRDVLDDMRLVPLRGGKPYFSSLFVDVLLDLVERRMGQSTTPAPLSLPVTARESFPLMGIQARRPSRAPVGVARDGTHGHDDDLDISPLSAAVAHLVQCLPLPSHESSATLSNEAQALIPTVHCTPLLPLQLARLLLSGLLWNCLSWAVRVSAFVTCALSARTGVDSDASHRSVDVVGLELSDVSTLSAAVSAFEEEVFARLAALSSSFHNGAPGCPMTALLQQSLPPSASRGDAQPPDAVCLGHRRQCVAFATYPNVWFVDSSSAVTHDDMFVGLLSKDGQRRAWVRAPSDVAVLSPEGCPSAFECFGSFDCEISCPPAATSNSGDEEICLFGTFAPPLAFTVASAGESNAADILSVADDVPTLGLMHNGSIPVVANKPSTLRAIQEMQHSVYMHVQVLHPISDPCQAVLDQLLLPDAYGQPLTSPMVGVVTQ